MLLKSKEIAFTGLVMAMGVVLIVIGSYLGTGTLFFLAASAFLAGVMERNFSLGLGVLYLIGVTLLGFLLSPQKLHIATFLVMGIYVLVAEGFEKRIYLKKKPVKPLVLWGSKCLVYHVLLGVALVILEVMFGLENALVGGLLEVVLGKSKLLAGVLLLIMAEVLWLVFDRAYLFFQRTYGYIFLEGK